MSALPPARDRTAALDAVTDLLRCPVCGQQLGRVRRQLSCPQRHSFDIARQGYVNLLGHAEPANADTSAMIAAREAFLTAGHFEPIADAVVSELTDCPRVLEVGAGSGYYLSRVLAAEPGRRGLATDISVAAARAQAGRGLAAVVCDTWAGLPVRDHCIDALLCVFAPRNAAEFARVLSPSGRLVVVSPGGEHLRQARDLLHLISIQPDKQSRLLAALAAQRLQEVSSTHLRFDIALSAEQVTALVAMGPNAFHPHQVASAALQVSCDAWVRVFSPAGDSNQPMAASA